MERGIWEREYGRGAVTVFLSLVLSVILSLIGAVITSARYSAARARTEMVMNMGLMSVFAEYNRELLSQYDLYFIDTSYGSGHPSIKALEEHLKSYIDYNCNPGKALSVFNASDMTGLRTDGIKIDLFSYATDQGGRVFKRQALHAIRDHYGLSIIEGLKQNLDDYNNSGIQDEDVDSERKKVEDKLSDIDLGAGDSPIEDVYDKRPGILNLILSGSLKTSDKELKLKNVTSRRKNNEGAGAIRMDDDPDSFTNELLFDEYLGWKLSCYTEDLGHDSCSYELEYVLNGKNTDIANLRSTVWKILLLREAANTMAIFTDGGKKTQAKIAAVAIALLVLHPELTNEISDLILFAWAFAEAVMEVRTLLSGGKVALMKSKDDWQLKTVLSIPLFLTRSPRTDGKGLTYKDYLKVFLALENSTDKVRRTLDVIEMNLRTTDGNEGFRMDGCVDYLQAEAKLRSNYGFDFSIRREFAYEAIVQ